MLQASALVTQGKIAWAWILSSRNRPLQALFRISQANSRMTLSFAICTWTTTARYCSTHPRNSSSSQSNSSTRRRLMWLRRGWALTSSKWPDSSSRLASYLEKLARKTETLKVQSNTAHQSKSRHACQYQWTWGGSKTILSRRTTLTWQATWYKTSPIR